MFYSEHNASMAQYEKACREANASSQEARKSWRQSIEDELVAGGQTAIDEYEQTLNKRAKRARCLAEYDGVSMGRDILRRAKERLANAGQTDRP